MCNSFSFDRKCRTFFFLTAQLLHYRLQTSVTLSVLTAACDCTTLSIPQICSITLMSLVHIAEIYDSVLCKDNMLNSGRATEAYVCMLKSIFVVTVLSHAYRCSFPLVKPYPSFVVQFEPEFLDHNNCETLLRNPEVSKPTRHLGETTENTPHRGSLRPHCQSHRGED